MKKNTYPVAGNAQAEAYREIFKDDTKPGRVKGINNSPNLIKLFPESPIYKIGTIDDRGELLQLGEESNEKLTNELIANMFAKVIDGQNNKQPHVLKKGANGDFTSDKNYNWLYRDQPIDMNFNYLKASTPDGTDFTRSSPDAETAPVGSNIPIENGPSDKPFWGHANLQVPSVNPFDVRETNVNPQLQRGTGGFGTSYPISNRAFASQEKIGTYFTQTYINTENAGDVGTEIDRMTFVAGKSINNKDNLNNPTDKNPDYAGDEDVIGSNSTTGTGTGNS